MDHWIHDKSDGLSSPGTSPISSELHSCARLQSQTYLDDYFGSSSSSDDGNEDVSHSVTSYSLGSTSKRLDYMLQFLDRKLSADYQNQSVGCDHHSRPAPSLPEFVAKGGGTGIYKVPVRGAVHPSRPPSLELRPHPLRESQIGRSLSFIASTDSQLWAASECGVRFWNYTDLYASSYGVEGDQETAPFMESTWSSPTTCLVADEGHRLVWSGHKDGKIRGWKMYYSLDESSENHFKDVLSWQAHRGPVLSLTMTSYGDLWSGSEFGVIKIWPWEAVEKSISSREEERHLAILLVERSYVDLRSQITANGFSNLLNSDVKYLLSDNSQGKVWSAGYFQFALCIEVFLGRGNRIYKGNGKSTALVIWCL